MDLMQDKLFLKKVYDPESYKDPEFREMAAAEYGYSIRCMPKFYISEHLVNLALENEPTVYQYLPEEFKTPENLEYAWTHMQIKYPFLKDFNPELMTEDNLKRLSINGPGYALALTPVPERTYDMCLAIMQYDGSMYEYVPEYYQTVKMFTEAVKTDGTALRFIPEEHITMAMCVDAISHTGFALEYVPENLISPAMVMDALETDYSVLQFVEDKFITSEVANKAKSIDIMSVEYLPEKYCSQNDYEQMVIKDGYSIKYVPEKYITEELCMKAVNGNPFIFKNLPEQYKTDRMYQYAIENSMKHFQQAFRETYPPQFFGLDKNQGLKQDRRQRIGEER